MTPRHTLRLALLCFVVLAPASASADVIPMDVTECDMHTVGAACTDPRGTGVCTMSTCTRVDYTIDAGGFPGSSSYACVRCVVPGATDTGPGGPDAGPMPAHPMSSCSVTPGAAASWSIGVLVLAMAALTRRTRA